MNKNSYMFFLGLYDENDESRFNHRYYRFLRRAKVRSRFYSRFKTFS